MKHINETIEIIKTSLKIGLLLGLPCAALAQPVNPQRLQGHVPAAAAHSTPVGRLEAARELKLAVGLPLRNKEALTNLLQRIYDPASPDYHHFLTPLQFADMFGPTEQDYQSVTAFAKSNGLTVTATSSNRVLLDVSGPVSSIEKAFQVTLRTYQHPQENRVFYAPDVEPSLDLATPVLHISGLDNYLLPHPMNLKRMPAVNSTGVVPAIGSGPGGAYEGDDFRAAYMPGVALTGSGQSVGLLEFESGYFQSDINAYEAQTSLPDVPVKAVLLDGYDGGAGFGNDEVSLDIEMAISMAPGLSSVIVYEGSFTDDILNQMATDDLANQLSASWTYGIDSESDQIFMQFAAQGQSFFNASGDGDAYVGSPATPTDDPNLTCVGGTTLTTSGPGGAWVSETVWNWDQEYPGTDDGIGSSGGISTTYPIPSWQAPVSMALNQGSTIYRNIPDVALTADNVFVIYDNGASGAFGGTSCATPLWAAVTALINQQATANGRPLLGFLNPAIYAIGLGPNYTSCFHDITTGNNTWSESPDLYYAVTGYDLCTGWGTPTGSNLINQLAPLDSLQISPLGGFAASGGVGGPLTPASESFTLTNIGMTTLSWDAAASVPWLNVSLHSGSLSPGGVTATVVVSLNASASNLFLGTYAGTVWFTNLTDGAAQSRAFSLMIIKPPVITSQPSSLSAIEGTTVSFTAAAAGGLPMNCQWRLNGINVTNNGRISGAQTNVVDAGNIYGSAVNLLTISNMTATDAGTYTLLASNAAGEVISSNAVLTITPSGPVILAQPASQVVLVGATVQLTVVAVGNMPLTYQWKQNGTNLTDVGGVVGSVTSALTISGASSASMGTYTVMVSNSISTATSTGAVVTVDVSGTGGQLVQNGGFETGSFSSWGESGNFTGCAVSGSPIAVYAGNYGALLGPAGSLGYLSQTLPTVAGQSYLLSLWLDSPDGLSPNEFLVGWNGSVVFDQTNLEAIGWTNLQFFVTATSSNTALEFGFRDDQSYLGLDDIQATPLLSADGPPVIATQPANQVALTGGAASFSVLAAGKLPLIYQWQFDHTNLPNATNATLALSNLATNQAGTYDVVISNSLGMTTSSNALLTILTGSAALITFDDLPGTGSPVPTGYHDLTWSNLYYLNAPEFGQPSGYLAGMISASNVAYNGGGTPAAMSGSGPFALLSAYLTAAWNDNLHVEVKGYIGSTVAYDNTYTLSATSPTFITFNYVGVTSVQFISSGGSPHPGYGGSGEHFVMDNVTVVLAPPTPSAVLYSFDGFDGGYPTSALVQGADGNFYGTTAYGGTYSDGTVFRMTTNGNLSTLFSFDYSDGAYPYAGLVQGADGNLYGTTASGGTNGNGTVFKITTNGTFTPLFSFNYTDGDYPYAALVQGADGNFYGTTESGGASGSGSVFKMKTNGALTSLVSFNGANGSAPLGALIQGTDGSFYGTTIDGGASTYYGTVFKMTTNDTLTTLHSFDYTDGAYPYGGLVLGPDGDFYGTTYEGGTNGNGTVFKITTNGTLTILVALDGTEGYYPDAGLVLGADGDFYGTTSYGGTYFAGGQSINANGTIFKVTTNGTLSTLLLFEGPNGSYPQASLVQGANGNFYGTAAYGGAGFNGSTSSGDGIVFTIGAAVPTTPPAIVAQPAGQTVPVNGTAIFSVSAGGAAPLNYTWRLNGSPISGATQSSYTNANVSLAASGGQYSCVINNAYGSVTSSNAPLTVFTASGPLFSFNGADGGSSVSALIQGTNGIFYGTTSYGGTNGQGTAFSLTTNGQLATLVSFNGAVTGSYPYAGLVQGADGNFYGTTSQGGPNEYYGTVFKMTPNGTLTTLAVFDYSDGGYSYAGLVQGADGNFYGTTADGGANYDGTVFKVTSNGTLTTLHSFDYTDGEQPEAALALGSDGNFYGTTYAGGANGYGTVFKMTTNGTLTTLHSFNDTDGAYPYGALVEGNDGNFYGTTTYGGANNDYGTVFKITSGGTLTTLLSFNYTDGGFPGAGLVQGTDGNFYGTASAGGTNGYGTIFRMAPSGALNELVAFDSTNGVAPQAALLQASDGNFYTTTEYGGLGLDGQYNSGNGTVFRLVGALVQGPPMIVTQPANQSVYVGGSATFCVEAEGTLPLSYFWSCNGVPIVGATNSCFTTNNVPLAANGSQFTCLVTNVFGASNSLPATLTVQLAPSNGIVAVFGAPATTSWNSDVTSNISNTLLLSQVSGFLAGSGEPIPTLAQLQQYSAVLVYSDATFSDNVGLGNVLADYLDAGGGVVVATFGFDSAGDGLSGRIVTGGYLPITTGSSIYGTELTLVADQPSHPILAGVSSFNGGSSSYHEGVATTAGATLVAHWTDSEPLVATKQLTAGRAVALNFYPPSSNVRSDFWQASTGGGLLMANALVWAGGGGGGGSSTVVSTTNAWNGSTGISEFGEPNTGTYGQTFVTPPQSSFLNSFTIYILNISNYVTFQFYVMAWNGSEATGPILYQSPPTNTAAASVWLPFTFNTGNLALTPGQTYVAFASASGSSGLAEMGFPSGHPYTNGSFVYNNNGTNFSLLTNSAWVNYESGASDLAFVAVFGGSSNQVQAPVITMQPTNVIVSVGGSATFSVSASGASPLSYFWFQNGTIIAGATNSSYTLSNVLASSSGSQFNCLVSNTYGTATSSVASLTVLSGCGSPIVITFDNVIAPDGFADASALTNQYASLGVVFAGPGGLNGGAILNSNANFGVTGFSPPNFLAFNTNATLSDGGIPEAPETMTFSPPVSFVSVLAGAEAAEEGETLELAAYNANNVLVMTSTISLAPAMATVQVTGASISKVVVTSQAPIFVLDNLTFMPACPPPQFQAVAISNGAINLSWSALEGQSYQVEYTTNLAKSIWSNLGAVLTATNTSMMASDTNISSAERFYRIVLLP